MNEIKEILKSKNYSVNEFVLKNIKKFNISLDEFILLLYFININNGLDVEDIKFRFGFTNEEIINLYSGLCKKGIIETIVNKKDKIIEETISLDSFYNKLLLSKEEEKENTDIFAKFENEFGRTLSPIEYETINNWINNNISEEMITSALKEAVLNGVSNLRYIDKILVEWTKKNIKKTRESAENIKLFDYDWLNDEDE